MIEEMGQAINVFGLAVDSFDIVYINGQENEIWKLQNEKLTILSRFFLVVFEGKDVVCLSREDFKDENGGAWDTDWDIFE